MSSKTAPAPKNTADTTASTDTQSSAVADSKLEEEPALPSHTDLLPADQTRILAQVRRMALTRVREALAFVYQHPGLTLTLTLTLTL